MTSAVAVPASAIADELQRIGVRWSVSVPDTHQRSLIAELERRDAFRVVTCSTEDEAVAVASGLYLGGEDAVLMIQHAGLYACVNNLRGLGLDAKMPLFLLIGLLGREPELPPRQSPKSMVRLAEPLLDALGIPYSLLEGPQQLDRLEAAFVSSRTRRGPVAVLIGHETR